MKNFKSLFLFLSFVIIPIGASDSDIFEYEIRFKNKVGPFSFDGLKTLTKLEKKFQVIFHGQHKNFLNY